MVLKLNKLVTLRVPGYFSQQFYMNYLGRTLDIEMNSALILMSTHLPNLSMLDLSCNISSNEACHVDNKTVNLLITGMPKLTYLLLRKVKHLNKRIPKSMQMGSQLSWLAWEILSV